MKNRLLQTRHPMMLTAAVILTVFSIISSVAAAGLIPLPDAIHSVMDNRYERLEKSEDRSRPNNKHDTSVSKESLKKAEFLHDQFNSVVQPRLSNCFNCGVVIAIETLSQESLLKQNIENYLDAHRENARIIVLGDESADAYSISDKNQELTDRSMTYLIKVRMQDGSQHSITQDTPPEHDIGDTIRLINERTITA